MWNDVSALEKAGYNLIHVPQEIIEPLQVFTGTNHVGSIANLLTKKDKLPKIEPDKVAADIEGTKKYKIGVGLVILEKFLSIFFRIEGGKLEVAFNSAKEIAFEFKDVKISFVDMGKLGEYLGSTPVNLSNSATKGITKKTFIISKTLKSKHFKVIAYDKTEAVVDINVDKVKGLLDIGTKVNVDKDAEGKVSFGDDKCLPGKYLPFAFQGWYIRKQQPKDGEVFLDLVPAEGKLGPLDASMPIQEKLAPVILDEKTLLLFRQRGE